MSKNWDNRLKTNGLVYVIKFSCLYAIFCVAVFLLFHDESGIDYDQYLAYSHWAGSTVAVGGKPITIVEPFASRALAPFLTYWISGLSGWPNEWVLKVLNLTVWLSVGPIIGRYLWTKGISFPRAAAVATTPYPALAATHYLIPDSLSVALLLLVILGLETGKAVVPMIASAALMLARNTSLLTIILWLLAGRQKIGLARICAVLGAAAVGLICLALIRPFPADNVHHMNTVSYLLLKLPVNYLRNLFSMEFFVNTKDWCQDPFITVDVSRLHFIGSVREVGLCTPVISRTIYTAVTLLFVLGVFPFLVLADVRRRFLQGTRVGTEFLLHTPEWCFLFLFFLIPGLGATVPRLALDAYVLLVPIVPILWSGRSVNNQMIALYLLYNVMGVVFVGVCEQQVHGLAQL
jgi:hypothetical protein